MAERISLRDLNQGESILLVSSANEFVAVDFHVGLFRIELWDASGGSSTCGRTNVGGSGGYTSGILVNKYDKTFYFYIGTRGGNGENGIPGSGGFNGGVAGGTDIIDHNCPSGGSGGATDMRIISGFFNNETSLLSRVMVAGGGGSAGCFINGGNGGHSGGVFGGKGMDNDSGQNKGGNGGNQTVGYSLGSGEPGINGDESSGSGGGGYWGGFRGEYSGVTATSAGGGGGGSSFISDHPTCFAMNALKHPLLSSIHPSHVLFTETNIISGNSQIPSMIEKNQIEFPGHRGDGGCRITFLQDFFPNLNSCSKHESLRVLPFVVISFLHQS